MAFFSCCDLSVAPPPLFFLSCTNRNLRVKVNLFCCIYSCKCVSVLPQMSVLHTYNMWIHNAVFCVRLAFCVCAHAPAFLLMEALWWWPCFDLAALSLILQQMRVVQCWRGSFGGLQQASVLGLEDQIEGLGDIKDGEGGKEKIGLKEKGRILSAV